MFAEFALREPRRAQAAEKPRDLPWCAESPGIFLGECLELGAIEGDWQDFALQRNRLARLAETVSAVTAIMSELFAEIVKEMAHEALRVFSQSQDLADATHIVTFPRFESFDQRLF